MAPMIFSNAILNDLPIEVFTGKMIRDFTYIDDVVEVLCRCCDNQLQLMKNLTKNSKSFIFICAL